MIALIIILAAILYLFLLLLEKLVAIREMVKKLSWELWFWKRQYRLVRDLDELRKLPLSEIEKIFGVTETAPI